MNNESPRRNPLLGRGLLIASTFLLVSAACPILAWDVQATRVIKAEDDQEELTRKDSSADLMDSSTAEKRTARSSLEDTLRAIMSDMSFADLALLVDIADAIHRRSYESQ